MLVCMPKSQGQTTIFDYGSSWKYLDNGSNQGTAWTGTTFNDATWASDTGFFGYGDTWITKCLNACGTVSCSPSCGTKYITTYFRKVVNIPSLAIYDSMRMSIKRDDAVAVYVNGVEVWRDVNMPTGTLNYLSTALTALSGVDEYTPITKTIPISFFTAGNNTIAVELHQQSGTSSDLGFTMQMIGIPSLTLFDYGSAWKYLDNGSNQGTSWTGSTFNDAAWVSDTGFFGYNDTWITKCVNACGTVSCAPSCGTKYITTYFRKVINIASLAAYDSIRFNIKRDDGFVAYVNGIEVWRDNMPTGTISYNTAAPVAMGGVDEYTPVVKSIPISVFSVGNNTIAVEVHQQSGTSSDLGFNMQIVAVPHVAVVPVSLSQGPYLQMGSQTAVNVRWRTNIASRSRVSVGIVPGSYPIVVNDTNRITEHDVRVTGLAANTKYFYRFGTDTSVIQGDSTNFFVTAPEDTSTRRVTIAAFGDCGRNDNNFQTGSLSSYQSYLASQNMKAADLMLLIGDNAYDAGTDLEFSTNFFNRYSSNILKNHMLFPCPGNHDYANSAARQVDHNVTYYRLFTLPSAGECGGVPSGTEAYYSYNWGNVHVLSLDSYGDENAGTTRMYDTLGAQVTWIKADLAANTKKWTVAYWHHPPYTMGSHNSDAEGELISIRQNFIKILERNGVDVIICGHSHDYERSYLLKGHYGTEASFNKAVHTADSSSAKYDGSTNSCPYTYPSGKVNHGTVYVVSGSAGADGGVQAGYPHNALPFSVDDGGMFYLDIQNNRLDAKFIRRDNTIGDRFTILKDTKVRDTIAAWPGNTVNLNATWQGGYAWNTGATTRAISVVVPNTDTLITVKDSLSRTCLTDQHYIDALCTTPVFTITPSNVMTGACNAVVTYTVADTGTPNPILTYSFGGATTGSGAGTGSGSLFNVGVTNVTITATNPCGSVNRSFSVTVNPIPATVAVTGGGAVCGSTTLTASNGGSGTIYYQGTASGGTSTATPATSQVINASGTYYFRSRSADGCWGTPGSATVAVNSIPAAVSVAGAGTYCGSTTITASNGGSGTIYFQGTISGGTSTSSPSSSEVISASGIYYFRALSASGCWGPEGSVILTINPVPADVTVSGGGPHCGETTLMASNGGSGTIYYQGATSGGTSVITPSVSEYISTSGTYYFRALSSAGCWGTEGSATVVINSLPAAVTVTGAGVFCDHSTILASNGGSGTIYYQGTIAGGTSVSTASVAELLTSSGVYYFRARSVAGCWGIEGNVAVTIHSLPVMYTVTGGGDYCASGSGVNVSLSGSEAGVNYQLYNGVAPLGSPVSGTGGILDFGMQTAAGSYTIAAKNVATLCEATMSGVATVVINPLPLDYTITGGGSYCAGATGVPVGLSSSQAGVNYQLYNGTTLVGAPLAGGGGPLNFGLHTSAGAYSVVATNATTLCHINMTGSASVAINALPFVYTVTGGGSYCAGGAGVHIGLSSSNSGVSYQLYKGTALVGSPVAGIGGAIDFGSFTAIGSYSVVATTTATGCSAAMAGSTSISINLLPTVYNVTGGGTYCAGGVGFHVNLSGSTTGINYQLYNGATPSGSIIPGTGGVLDFGLRTVSGSYAAVATNATTSCSSNMAGSAVIAANALPVSYTITGGGSYCAGAGGGAYRLVRISIGC